MKEFRKLGPVLADDDGLKVNNTMNYSFVLTPVLADLLKTEELARLYTLRQLSFCYVLDFKSTNMGFISATHSRLEHSIIVADYLRYFFNERHGGYDSLQEHAEVEALLHDCGHTACSHAFEMDTRRSQDQQVEDIIFGRAKNNGCPTVAEILEKYNLDKRKIFEAITEKNNNPDTILISQFCDRLAYIVEDAHRSHSEIDLKVNWRGGSLKAAKTILEDCLAIKDNELYADLAGTEINNRLIEGELQDTEWINLVASMCCSRTQLFMNVYGSPSNSKCVTLARNAAQIGYEEGWLHDEELYYLNDEQLIKKFLGRKSTKILAQQLKARELPDTALAVSLDEQDYQRLLGLREKRDKRLEFDEKVNGYLDINPLAKFSMPKINYIAQNQNGKLNELLLETCSDVRSYKDIHEAWVTRRLVVYAKKGEDPKNVAAKAVAELGIELYDEEPITLNGFQLND